MYGGLDGPKGQESICVATTWLRQHQILQHNRRTATLQPRTPPTVAEIMGIRKAQHTIKCRKPRRTIAATSCGSDCHLLVEDDGLTELKVMEGCVGFGGKAIGVVYFCVGGVRVVATKLLPRILTLVPLVRPVRRRVSRRQFVFDWLNTLTPVIDTCNRVQIPQGKDKSVYVSRWIDALTALNTTSDSRIIHSDLILFTTN